MRLKRLISDKSGNTIFSRRFWKFLKQRMKYGFDQSDTLNLSYTIAEFILPRLKMFRDVTVGYPAGQKISGIEEWKETLDKMIMAFDYIIKYDNHNHDFEKELKDKAEQLTKTLTPEEIKAYKSPWSYPRYNDIITDMDYYNYSVREGLDLFAKYYNNLWW